MYCKNFLWQDYWRKINIVLNLGDILVAWTLPPKKMQLQRSLSNSKNYSWNHSYKLSILMATNTNWLLEKQNHSKKNPTKQKVLFKTTEASTLHVTCNPFPIHQSSPLLCQHTLRSLSAAPPHGLQPSTTQIPVREQSQSSEALRTAHEESLHAEQDYFTALHGTVVLITNQKPKNNLFFFLVL